MALAQTFMAPEATLERGEWQRWSVAAAVVVALHVVVALVLVPRAEDLDADAGSPAVMVELAPLAAAPPALPSDLAPGPEQPQTEAQEAQEKPPEEKPPEIERPPEDAVPDPAVPPPEPPKPDEKPQQQAQDASVSMAPPSAPTEAERAAGPPPGEVARPNSAAVLTWQRTLSAHLQRFKRYPPKAQANREQGIATVGFSMDRQGHVTSSHIVRSSGLALLDEETLTMLRRAQPLPRPPADATDAQLTFVFPIRYTAR
jgi:protein TonB